MPSELAKVLKLARTISARQARQGAKHAKTVLKYYCTSLLLKKSWRAWLLGVLAVTWRLGLQ
jgi:hypothetical protein